MKVWMSVTAAGLPMHVLFVMTSKSRMRRCMIKLVIISVFNTQRIRLINHSLQMDARDMDHFRASTPRQPLS